MKLKIEINDELKSADCTESLRRQRHGEINSDSGSRAALEQTYGQVWDTTQLQQEFSVTGFLAPYVVVRRKDNFEVGTLEFQHQPRFYFNYRKDG